jgi:hypothetical protein
VLAGPDEPTVFQDVNGPNGNGQNSNGPGAYGQTGYGSDNKRNTAGEGQVDPEGSKQVAGLDRGRSSAGDGGGDRVLAVDASGTGLAFGRYDDVVGSAGMVSIPGGEFLMGRDDGNDYERPAHLVKSGAVPGRQSTK